MTSLPPRSPFGDLELEVTVKEAALICRRHPRTIRNLIWLHDLPVRYGREPVRGRQLRRRIILIPPATLRRLRRLTGA